MRDNSKRNYRRKMLGLFDETFNIVYKNLPKSS